jgi:hypothetical protein
MVSGVDAALPGDRTPRSASSSINDSGCRKRLPLPSPPEQTQRAEARFTSKADIEATQTDVRLVPKADIRETTSAKRKDRFFLPYPSRPRGCA